MSEMKRSSSEPEFSQSGVLTYVGEKKLNAVAASGGKVDINRFVLGDGGGNIVNPNKEGTSLINEFARLPITESKRDRISAGILMTPEISSQYKGMVIRECGLIDTDGDLIVWCNYLPTQIILLNERQIIISLPIVSTDNVNIVFESLFYATRDELKQNLEDNKIIVETGLQEAQNIFLETLLGQRIFRNSITISSDLPTGYPNEGDEWIVI